MYLLRRILALLLPAAILIGDSATGDEAAPPKAATGKESARADDSGWQKLFRKMAEDYEIASAGESPRKFGLRQAPVLRWSQPVRGGDDGAVYLWVDEGRPAVIGSLFAWPDNEGLRHVVHEFHALTHQPMQAAYQGNRIWSLDKPALEFKRLPAAAAPATAAAKRL